MAKLSEQLAALVQEKKGLIPEEALTVMLRATEELKGSGIEDKLVKTGDKAPDFSLANQVGQQRSLGEFLAKGPLVVSFYRGGW